MLDLLIYYDPIIINILISIDDILTLYKLYCTNVNKYHKFLNDKWVLNKLATNFDFKGKYNTFDDFKRMYRMKKLEAPLYSDIDSPYGCTGLYITNESCKPWIHKRKWLEKLEIIQHSKKVNKYKFLHSSEYYYRSKDDEIQWTYEVLLCLDQSAYRYVPNKRLFDFIIDLYEEEFEQTKILIHI